MMISWEAVNLKKEARVERVATKLSGVPPKFVQINLILFVLFSSMKFRK